MANLFDNTRNYVLGDPKRTPQPLLKLALQKGR